jgi:hypothetical protein
LEDVQLGTCSFCLFWYGVERCWIWTPRVWHYSSSGSFKKADNRAISTILRMQYLPICTRKQAQPWGRLHEMHGIHFSLLSMQECKSKQKSLEQVKTLTTSKMIHSYKMKRINTFLSDEKNQYNWLPPCSTTFYITEYENMGYKISMFKWKVFNYIDSFWILSSTQTYWVYEIRRNRYA